MSYSYVERTQTGSQKIQNGKENEDSYIIDKERSIILLADGIGGQKAAKLASNMAVNITHLQLCKVYDQLKKGNITEKDITKGIEESMQLANYIISTAGMAPKKMKGAQSNIKKFMSELPAEPIGIDYLKNANKILDSTSLSEKISSSVQDMGATLDVILIHNDKVYCGHAGNGRIIKVDNEGNYKKLTTEHVDYEGLIEGQNHPYWELIEGRFRLANSIGMGNNLVIDTKVELIMKHDCIYMYSDGVAETASLKEISAAAKYFFKKSAERILTLHEAPEEQASLYAKIKNISLKEAEDKLAGRDNATIIGIKRTGWY